MNGTGALLGLRHLAGWRRASVFVLAVLCAAATGAAGAEAEEFNMESVNLPQPRRDSGFSVERALHDRRSVRDFSAAPLSLAEIGQLLWAAQGITSPEGLRTAPSAGALYPLETVVVAGRVAGLAPGIYRYAPSGHAVQRIAAGDVRTALARAALDQQWIQSAPAVIVFSAIEKRTTGKYGNRGLSYIYIEVGHAAQNVFLQAEALGLGAAAVGAFDEKEIAGLLRLPTEQRPLYLMPVGKPAGR